MQENIRYVWIGFIGMALSFVYRIPQTAKIMKTKSYKDISVATIHIQNLSYVFYTIYAYLIHDPVNIVASVVSTLQNFFILFLIWRYSSIETGKSSIQIQRSSSGEIDLTSVQIEK